MKESRKRDCLCNKDRLNSIRPLVLVCGDPAPADTRPQYCPLCVDIRPACGSAGTTLVHHSLRFTELSRVKRLSVRTYLTHSLGKKELLLIFLHSPTPNAMDTAIANVLWASSVSRARPLLVLSGRSHCVHFSWSKTRPCQLATAQASWWKRQRRSSTYDHGCCSI